MGGYGFNVWSVYAIFAVFVAANLILPIRKKKRIVHQLRRRLVVEAEVQRNSDKQ
jgi:heme exporter protein CcmD